MTYHGLDGTYSLVLMATGAVVSWSYTLQGADVRASNAGDAVHYADATDFRGGVGVRAQITAARAGLGESMTYPLELSGTFVGRIGMPPPFSVRDGVREDATTVTSIERTWACPCRFSALGGPDALGPGAATVERTYAEAVLLQPSVVLYGADVVLPT